MSTAIQLERIEVKIGDRQILQDLSASIPAGAITGLLGPSGAGKTTLMRALVGLKRVQGGKLVVLGDKPGSPALRRRTGYMTQAVSVYQDLTVGENLNYFAALVAAPRAQVNEIIDRVSLEECKNQLVSSLSGGQRARVSLAAALLGRPKLLVLDEPTVGLDPVLRQELWAQFRELAAGGTTLVISSHVMEEAEHCHYLLLMREGSVIASGSPRQIMKSVSAQTMEQAFLLIVRERSA